MNGNPYKKDTSSSGAALFPKNLRAIKALELVEPRDLLNMARVDDRLGGPSLLSINQNGSGNYEIAGRDVFRPLQYCVMHFCQGLQAGDLE